MTSPGLAGEPVGALTLRGCFSTYKLMSGSSSLILGVLTCKMGDLFHFQGWHKE